jgi:preprotein translocase subunit SecE
MADESDRDDPEAAPEGGLERPVDAELELAESARLGEDSGDSSETVTGELGAQRYVHAAFLAAGLLAAFLFGRLLQSAWNSLLDWPEVVRAVPSLLEYSEEQRGNLTLAIGAVLGVVVVLRYYRRPAVQNWAKGVASELARVTWPSKDTVTSGTVVVLVAGAIATFYVAVLDRLWSYLTGLVYGA